MKTTQNSNHVQVTDLQKETSTIFQFTKQADTKAAFYIEQSKLGTTYQLKSKLLIQILRKPYKHTSQRQRTRQKFEQMTLSQQSLDSSKVNNSYTYNTILFYVCKLFIFFKLKYFVSIFQKYNPVFARLRLRLDFDKES